MEKRRNINAIGARDSMIMKSLEQQEGARSHNDIMTRRLKNRERQRRYRARKRLEADRNGTSSVITESITTKELALDGNHSNYLTRVHCKRNWKKDARKAHARKSLEEASCAAVISVLTLDSESQTHSLVVRMSVEPPLLDHSDLSLSLPSSETKTKLSRRDWKAEARKKKN